MKRFLEQIKRVRKVHVLIFAMAVILLAIVPVSAAMNANAEEDAMIRDMASLSGIEESELRTIVSLRDTISEVQENLFVYKEILDIWSTADLKEKEIMNLIEEYEPQDIFCVLEYLSQNNLSIDQTGDLLAENAEGVSFEELLPTADEQKTYKTYRPLGEDQIREWLGNGLLPEDILIADEIAMTLDRDIETILSMKTSETSWDQIKKELGYESDEPENTAETVTIQVEDENGKRSNYQGETYEDAVQIANEKEELRREKKEENALQKERESAYKTDLPQNRIIQYEEEGFNSAELENAARLSKESGVPADKILEEKQNGADWETLIRKYHKENEEANR